MHFSFVIDDKSQAYAEKVVAYMVREFGVRSEAAIAYLEKSWAKVPFDGPDDIRYHETPEYWGRRMYNYHVRGM